MRYISRQRIAAQEEDRMSEDQLEYQLTEPAEDQPLLDRRIKIHILVFFVAVIAQQLTANSHLSPININGQQYLLLETKYSSFLLINQTKVTRYQKIINELQKIHVYIPFHSLYLDNSQQKQLQGAEAWRGNLIAQGTMLEELESWVLAHVKDGHECLVFWRENLSLTIILMATLLKNSQKSVITLLIDPNRPKAPINAFKESLTYLDLVGIVDIMTFPEGIVPGEISTYHIIIAPGFLLHNQILEEYIGQSDAFDPDIQKRVAASFLSDYSQQQFVLYYEYGINKFQTLQLGWLTNKIAIIGRHKEGGFEEIDLPKNKDIQIKRGFRIVVLNNQTDSKVNTHQALVVQSNKSSSEKKLPAEEEVVSQKTQNQVIFQGSKAQPKIVDAKSSNNYAAEVAKPQVHIHRVSRGQVEAIYYCTVPGDLVNASPGDKVQSRFPDIKIVRQEYINKEDMTDVSHLAKFLVAYLAQQQPINTYYSLENQQIANLIPNKTHGTVFLSAYLKKYSTIQQSLNLNYPSSEVITKYVKPAQLASFVQENEVRLVIAELATAIQWMQAMEGQLPKVIDIIVRCKNNRNERGLIEALRLLDWNIYVITPRKQTQFDFNCTKDFQFVSFEPEAQYHPESFYFISFLDIVVDSVDPLFFSNSSFARTTKIYPEKCTSPVTTPTVFETVSDLVLTSNRYGYPIYYPAKSLNESLRCQNEDQGLIQFINSCLSANQRVAIYTDNICHQLLFVTLLKKVEGQGSIEFFPLATAEQELLINKNADTNKLSEAFTIITEISASQVDSRYIRYYYNKTKPSFFLTNKKVLVQSLQVLPLLTKGTVLAFKCDGEGYNKLLEELALSFSLYKIIPSLKKATCQRYEAKLLQKSQSRKYGDGWFVMIL